MNINKDFKIYLENSDFYRDVENQQMVWRGVKALVAEESLSREGLLNEMSILFANPNLKVFIPLLGDIEGWQRYLIPSVPQIFNSGRWISYYLKADLNGNQRHSPVRLTERLRMFHLYIQIKQHMAQTL